MPQNGQTQTDEHVEGEEHGKDSERGLWIIIGVGALMLVAVFVVGSFFLDSGKIRFITEFSLTVVLATLVGVQAYIYRRQWEVMAQQRAAMQDSIERTDKVIAKMGEQLDAVKRQESILAKQAKTMDQSLVFGTRAYLGIQSVNFDIASKRLFLHIENVGKVPAKDVVVITEIKAVVPETKYRAFCNQPQICDWAEKGNERRLQVPFLNPLGRTRVFPGSLRMPILIRLDEFPYMSDQQLSLITGGYAKFAIRGLITYSDGFNSGKKTEFAFRYFGKNNLWVPELIEGPEYQIDERPDSDYKPS